MLIAASLATQRSASTHSMSHPAGAHFGVPHGVANAINLPWVIRSTRPAATTSPSATATSTRLLGLETGGRATPRSRTRWPSTCAASRAPRPAQRLTEVGVPESGIPQLVEGAMGDGCTLVNPREPTEEEFEELFRAAL